MKRHVLLIGIIVPVAAAFWSIPASQVPRISAEVKSAGEGFRTVFGPFWSTRAGRDTIVLLSNPTVETQNIRIRFFSSERMEAEATIPLGPAQNVARAASEFVRPGQTGYFSLEFPEDLQLLPAQTILTDGPRTWTLDVHDPTLSKPESRFALIPSPKHGEPGSKVTIILTNTGPLRLDGEVVMQDGERTRELRWRLEAAESRSIHLNSSGFHGASAIGLTIQGDSGLNDLAVGAWCRTSSQVRTLRFRPAEEASSMAGFYSSQADMLLWNLSDLPVSGEMSVTTPEATVSAPVELGPGEVSRLPISGTRLMEGSPGAVQLHFPEGTRVVAETLSRGQETSPLKDVSNSPVGHSFPLRISEGLTTKLSLYNPDSEPMRISLLLYFGDERFTYPLKRLEPGEFVQIDLASARREGLAGDTGEEFPEGAVGQVKIYQWDRSQSRLKARAEWEDETTGERVVFESCPLCPPVIVETFFSVSTIHSFVGFTESFTVIGRYNDFSEEDVTGDCFYQLDNPSLGLVGLGSVSFLQTGTANLSASLSCEVCEEIPVNGCTAVGVGILVAGILLFSESPPSVELIVSNGQITLLQTTNLSISVSPSSTSVFLYTIEIRRATSSTWSTFSTSPIVNKTGRVAGAFRLRANILTNSLHSFNSDEEDLIIQFPSYSDIVANSAVQQQTDQAWQSTLAATTPTSRREEGFWIRLNTSNGQYAFTQTIVGPTVGNPTGATINLGSRPADLPSNPAPNGTAIYTVSSFHTHTPTTFRTVGRPVGPSTADQQAHNSMGMLGIVYDYVAASGGSIPAHHPLNSPAMRFQAGPQKRTTPQ